MGGGRALAPPPPSTPPQPPRATHLHRPAVHPSPPPHTESYFIRVDFIMRRLLLLDERIEDTEDLIAIEMDHRRWVTRRGGWGRGWREGGGARMHACMERSRAGNSCPRRCRRLIASSACQERAGGPGSHRHHHHHGLCVGGGERGQGNEGRAAQHPRAAPRPTPPPTPCGAQMIAGFFGMNLWNTVWQEDQTVFYWVFGELRIPGGARMGPVMRGASARASSP